MTTHNKGIVFDIQHTSLHDGPGIRTTVFLKGCPLNCLWCHNPESIDPNPQVSYNASKCVSCLTCLAYCDHQAHQSSDGNHIWRCSVCTNCGQCITHCPTGALEMIGTQMTVEDIVKEIIKDQAFYEASGGGLTLSGGEPMLQFKLTQEILKAAKEENIHTCLETCGEAPWLHFEALLDLVDIFLFDYKTGFPKEHPHLTGHSNTRILKNLDLLYHSKANIILRCPLIPGLNDSEAHLDRIIEIIHQYPNLSGIEIMPYHHLGQEKMLRIRQKHQTIKFLAADKQQKATWMSYFFRNGITEISLGE